MTRGQLTRKKWIGTLPTLLVGVMLGYTVFSARFMPHISDPAGQSSRMTAWEGGPLSRPSYSHTLKASQERSKKSPSGSFLSKTSGPGWKMWDRSSVLFANMNLTCNWNDYRPFIRGEVAPAVPFCAHPLSDDHFVSNSIVKKGRHVECDGLPTLLARGQGNDASNKDSPIIYVDVGANIGTCVMQMLLTTNATILAFEPHPYNLFVMTSTFMRLDETLRDRIHLFPIALGAESAESTIHMASDNRGHAVVSKVIKINNRATFLPPMPIRVEPLDSIVHDGTRVHLMKMDAQGFECYIFDGMKRVLRTSRVVFFELEKKVLNGFERCSPQVLWDKFMQLGFQMHVGGPNRKATTEMPEKGKINIVALKL
ncbi:Inherit from COG: Methyltransferase [Seminavis robusta]|uniref:Inherit from COG: Methyltransferase n=1 Tax=Seminavis robusta TaxID=568900 RepID=A0A9N8DIC9_9STRA|nr:Inherit from COG: Methyltransferase [Seminavis robusta]|eukprot:Sro104_g053020.1 Inherit from COG: Methyltransferase (369) ;mRNA; f:108502-109608